MDIGGYLRYARVQLIDENKPFVVTKARGNVILNAFKVAQIANQTITGVLSCTKLCMRFTKGRLKKDTSRMGYVTRGRKKPIEEFDMYETLIQASYLLSRSSFTLKKVSTTLGGFKSKNLAKNFLRI
jgi:hypothetical protein